MKTRIQIARSDIVKHFDNLPSKILRRSQIAEILSENRAFWRLTQSITVDQFIQFLLESTKFSRVKVAFPYRPEIRYVWGQAPLLEVVLSLKPNSYLSHYTAMYVHGLTEQVPKTLYLNQEQPPKPRGVELAQHRIDAAFRRKARETSNVAEYGGYTICVLSGMHTDNLGVIQTEGPNGEAIHTTNMERTLIDIAVRPNYSGGVFEVLKAYRLAGGRTSVNRLAATLKRIGYIYPYHQAIGFYLSRSGVYASSAVDLLRQFPMEYDFYLTYDMKEAEYSKEWRLFFPKGL
jgi:hypothetical protein